MNDLVLLTIFILHAFCGFMLGFYTKAEEMDRMLKEAIDREFAQYNPKTGKLEWKR